MLTADAQAPSIAPRITPADIEASIVGELFIHPAEAATLHGFYPAKDDPLNLLTICVLTLKNGFTVVGTSACASAANYDVGVGHAIARANAVEKIWLLMGYELRTRLSMLQAGMKETG